jgi:hypothetical protein
MSGKGSDRRPQQAPEDEVSANWARIFGKDKTNQPNGTEPEDKERQDGGC